MSRDHVVCVRLSGKELAALRSVADRSGRTVSEVVRAAGQSLAKEKFLDQWSAAAGSCAPPGPMIVWDNGVAGPNREPTMTW